MENPSQMTEEREAVSTQDTPDTPQGAPEQPQSEQPRNGQENPQPQAAETAHSEQQAQPAPQEQPQAQAQPQPQEQAQPAPQASAGEPPADQPAEPPQPAPAQPAEQAATQTTEQAAPQEQAAAATTEAAAPAEGEAKPEEQKSGGEGSMAGGAIGDAERTAENPLGRPLSTSFDFMVSDEEFEEMIKKFCRDLTKRCAAGREDPVIGRDEEVIKMSTILLQRGRSNVVLLAEGGVGKTALFSALAHYFVSDKVPDIYKGARVIDVDLTSMAAGTASRAEFEGRLKPFLQACTERNEERCYGTPIVICLDEIHTTMGSCKASSAAGVADVMKPALTAGNLYVVGATTVEEYNLYCKPDAAYDRRFQKIHLNEPTVDDTIHILKGLKKKYADYHNLTISDELIEWHVPIVTKFLRKRMNPDKSIMMLDAACAEALKEGAFGGELTKEHCARAIGSEAGVKWQALIDGL